MRAVLLALVLLAALPGRAAPREMIHPKAAGDYVQPLSTADVAFQMLEDGDYLDSLNMAVFPDDGSVLFMQAVVSNLGFSSHAPAVHIKYFEPGGTKLFYGKDYKPEELKLSQDRASIEIGPCRYQYQEDTRGYKVHAVSHPGADRAIEVDLQIVPDSMGFKAQDGKIYMGAEREDWFYEAFPMPRGRISGWVSVDGKRKEIKGNGFVSRTVQNLKPHLLGTTWHIVKIQNAEATLNMTSFLTPEEFGRQRSIVGSFSRDGKTVAVILDGSVEAVDPVLDPETDYAYPRELVYRWKGSTVDGRPFSAEARFAPDRIIDKFDVLAHLPWILRVIIKAFIARPYYYLSYQPVTAEVHVGEETYMLAGHAFNEVIFVNPE